MFASITTAVFSVGAAALCLALVIARLLGFVVVVVVVVVVSAWSAHRTSWYTRKGVLNVVSHNIRKALPVAYYEQLIDALFGYKEESTTDYFDHLDDHWCKMDRKTTKSMTKTFYEPWNQVEHITKFAQRLNDQQVYLNGHDGIEITYANKL